MQVQKHLMKEVLDRIVSSQLLSSLFASHFLVCFETHEVLYKEVDDLHTAEDGEAGEEPHGASNETQRCLSCHLLIFFNFIICLCGKVDLEKLNRLIRDILG